MGLYRGLDGVMFVGGKSKRLCSEARAGDQTLTRLLYFPAGDQTLTP